MTVFRNAGAKTMRSFVNTLCSVRILVVALIVAQIESCDEHGLAPVPSTGTGFSGRIVVKSGWPAADSLNRLLVVAFRHYPPSDIFTEFNNNRLLLSEPLLLNQEMQSYSVLNDTLTGVFEYVVVAQQYWTNPFTDWRVVGVFAKSGDARRPSTVHIDPGRKIEGIDIEIDFYNRPPQPF